MFDPSIYVFSFSWTIAIVLSVLVPSVTWKIKTSVSVGFAFIMNIFSNEVTQLSSLNLKGVTKIPMLFFFSIIVMNLVALFPFNFSLTAHLTMNLPIALCTWMSIFLFSSFKKTKHTMIHLVPQGTPTFLMNFMVLIELVSNLIRPLTLCVRLTANLVAGHLLMSLLGGAMISLSVTSSFLMSVLPMILTILETAVSGIQAYVFMTLVMLYAAETYYDPKV